MNELQNPTPYDNIDFLLQILLDDIRAVLGDCFTGMYLYGSLAIGDFDASRSDIDFLVVTGKELPNKVAFCVSFVADV